MNDVVAMFLLSSCMNARDHLRGRLTTCCILSGFVHGQSPVNPQNSEQKHFDITKNLTGLHNYDGNSVVEEIITD